MKSVLIGLAITFLIIAVVAVSKHPKPDGKVLIGGGPRGGALVVFAESLKKLLDEKNPDLDVRVIDPGGSVANLRGLETGKLDLAWCYATDISRGYRGQLVPAQPKLEKVRVLGRVYSSAAQLVVKADSVIHSPFDMAGRRVAIGCSGSGSAHSARRYFTALGIWDKIIPLYMGYGLGIEEMNKGRAEAVWQLTSVPGPALQALSAEQPIRLIDLYDAAHRYRFFIDYPLYRKVEIAAGTYSGIDTPVQTFQDNTLLVARDDTNSERIETTLEVLFSKEGMRTLAENHPVSDGPDPAKGLEGVKTPLHPRAAAFWKERKRNGRQL